MTEIVSVRFKNKGKVYFCAPGDAVVSDGNAVIVDTSKGPEYAICTWGNHWVDDERITQPLRPVIRVATEDDVRRYEENRAREAEAFRICEEKIAARELDMKLVDVEYNFEGSKILFFFTSEGRVDFRELVKDLAGVFHTRIELRQIGVRDEAKMLGGLGICGRPFCCSQYMEDFHPVSIKMAKTQGLSLNPAKISGTCGRLMCCLKYEQVAYEDLVKQAPKQDAFVDTPGGKGTVVTVNLLRSYAKVRLEDSNDTVPKTYPFDELEILGGKARRAEYIAARDAGRLEEAGFAPSRIRRSRLEEPLTVKEEEAPFVFADGTVAEKKAETEPPRQEKPHGRRRNRKNRHSQEQPKAAGDRPAAASGEETRHDQHRGRHGKNSRNGTGKNPAGNAQTGAVKPSPHGETKNASPHKEGEPNRNRNPHRRHRRKGGGPRPDAGSQS